MNNLKSILIYFLAILWVLPIIIMLGIILLAIVSIVSVIIVSFIVLGLPTYIIFYFLKEIELKTKIEEK